MSVAIKNDLSKFLGKLGNVEQTAIKSVLKRVEDFGVKEAKSQYNTNPDKKSSIVVTSSIVGDEVTITAQGKHIAYLEYGTGTVGDGTYDGKLPTQPLTFMSPKEHKDKDGTLLPGVWHTTNGWVYNYPNKDTKHDGGWSYKLGDKTIFTKGRKAQAQMFNTAQEIKRVFRAKRSK